MAQTDKSNLPPFNRETRAIEAPHVPGKLKTVSTEVVWLVGTNTRMLINVRDFDPTVHEHIRDETPDQSDADSPADDSDADSSEKGEEEHDAETTESGEEGSTETTEKASPKRRKTTGK